jgi:hypothetical protein
MTDGRPPPRRPVRKQPLQAWPQPPIPRDVNAPPHPMEDALQGNAPHVNAVSDQRPLNGRGVKLMQGRVQPPQRLGYRRERRREHEVPRHFLHHIELAPQQRRIGAREEDPGRRVPRRGDGVLHDALPQRLPGLRIVLEDAEDQAPRPFGGRPAELKLEDGGLKAPRQRLGAPLVRQGWTPPLPAEHREESRRERVRDAVRRQVHPNASTRQYQTAA